MATPNPYESPLEPSAKTQRAVAPFVVASLFSAITGILALAVSTYFLLGGPYSVAYAALAVALLSFVASPTLLFIAITRRAENR